MTVNTKKFDNWIRGDFVTLNTQLEELYFATENPEVVEGVGEDIKALLVEQGKAFIVDLLKEGNTDEGYDAGFDLLGQRWLLHGRLSQTWNYGALARD